MDEQQLINLLNDINLLYNRKNNINELLKIINDEDKNKQILSNPTILIQQTNDKINQQINKISNGDFYLFSYGSNIPKQLAERFSKGLEYNLNSLNILEHEIEKNSIAAHISDMTRGFFSYSKTWHGAVATMVKEDNKKINGIALKINKNNYIFKIGNLDINFRNLMVSEAVNTGKYELKQVPLILSSENKNTNNGYAFIGNIDTYRSANANCNPHIKYLTEITKMLKYRRNLLNINSNEDINIDILLFRDNKWKSKKKKTFKVNEL